MEKIYIENIPISFTRKNIKNINIRICPPDGEVKVSAPMLISMRRVEKFVQDRKDWILSSQQKVLDKANAKNDYFKQMFEKANNEKEVAELKKWYAQELIFQAQPYFEKWKAQTGLYPNDVVVRWPKTLWGTCDKRSKKIMLNGQLVAMDKKYLDYVVLHELTHLKYANHGEDFKNFMSEYMPNWKQIRKELNG